MAKFLSSFYPARSKTQQEAEDYYLGRHTPFVQKFFLETQPAMQLYVPQAAVSRWDRGEEIAPTAWRWVVTERARGTDYKPDPEHQRRIDADHVQFLSELRAFYLKPQVMTDRGGRPGRGDKYIIEYNRAEPNGEQHAKDAYQRHLDAFAAAVATCDGVTLFISNDVRAELATAALDEPRQKLGRGFLSKTDLVAVDELWFTKHEAARGFLMRPEVASLLASNEFDAVVVHEVRESVLVDRRG